MKKCEVKHIEAEVRLLLKCEAFVSVSIAIVTAKEYALFAYKQLYLFLLFLETSVKLLSKMGAGIRPTALNTKHT